MASDLTQGYIRHPSEIPAQLSLCSPADFKHRSIDAAGHIGISITTEQFYPMGTPMNFQISFQKPAFQAVGHTTWCIPQRDGSFLTGIIFDDPETAYAVRMIEQICHIEQYRQAIETSEGRQLTQEAAASEWIARFAKDFPNCVPNDKVAN